MCGWRSRPEAFAAAGVVALLAAACLDAPTGPAASRDAGTDAGTPAPCGTTRAMRDEFDQLSPMWEGWGDTPGETANGRRLIYAAPSQQGGLITAWKFLAEGGEVTVSFRRIGTGVDGRVAVLLGDGGDDSIGLELTGGTLAMTMNVDGSVTTPASTAWTEDMLWWRMREVGGQIHWATATNGEDWQEHDPVDNPLPGLVRLELGLSAGADSEQAVVEIEAINPGSTEPECPAASLMDEFDGLSPRWAATEVPGCDVAADGELVIEYDAAEACGIYSAEHFDLRGSEVAVDVKPGDCDPSVVLAVDIAGMSAVIECSSDGGPARLEAGLYGDGGPGTLATLEFDPTAHRLWRISNAPGSGELALSVATAQGAWERLASTSIEEDALTAAGISLLVTDETPDEVTEQILFDRFNLVP